MPAPIAPLIVVGLGLALLFGRKKTPPAEPVGPVNPIKPVVNIDSTTPVNPWRGSGTQCETDFDGRSVDQQNAVLHQLAAMSDADRAVALACGRTDVGPAAPTKVYSYTIAGNEFDGNPSALISSWTGGYDDDKLKALFASNPGLHDLQGWKVVFVQSDPASGDKTIGASFQTVWLPVGVDANRKVHSGDTAGTDYPNNPTPGFDGQWVQQGSVGYTLSPWQVGQTVMIPPAWGDPPRSELASNATVVNTPGTV